MSRYEDLKKKRSSRTEEEKDQKQSTQSRYQKIKENRGGRNYGVDDSFINTFMQDAQNFLKTSSDERKGLTWQSGTDKSKNRSREETWSDLNSRSAVIRAFLNANKSRIGEDTYKELASTLDSITSANKDVFHSFRNAEKYYSQWDTEDDYNAAVKQAEAEAKKWNELTGGYDPSKNQQEGKAGWDDYVATQEQHAQRAAANEEKANAEKAAAENELEELYAFYDKAYTIESWHTEYSTRGNDLHDAQDDINLAIYNELVQKYGSFSGLKKRIREKEQDLGLRYSWEQFLEDLGRWMGPGVNPDTSLPLHIDVGQASKEYQDKDTQMRAPKDNWTDEHRETFGYLWNTQRQKAYEYAYAINNMLNVQAENAKIEEIQSGATDNFWAGAANTAGAILTAPLGLADYLGDLIAAGAVDQVPQADGEITPFEYSQAVTGGISQHLNDTGGVLDEDIPVIGGKGWGDVYGLGTSIAQSALAAYSGGSGQALVTFFGSAAASGVDDALSRGATNEQAVAYGTLSGLAEALAEQIGVDNLLKIGASSTMREMVWNIVKQGVAEGLEEGATTLMNNFADQLVMQDKSNFNILVKQYMDKGMSEDDAKKQAWVDMANDMAFDMLGGFASGAVHAGPQTAYQTIATNSETKAKYGASQNELVSEALEIDPGNAFAQKMQGRLDSGKNLSGGQMNRLVQQNEAALTAQDMSSIQSAAESRLAELGETGDVSAIAAALAKQAAGEKLSRAEQMAIANSKYGQRVANELNTENIQSGDYSSEWAQKLNTNRINVDEYSRLVEAAQLPQDGAEVTGSQVATKALKTVQAVQPDAVNAPAATVLENRTVKTQPESQYDVSDDGKTYDNNNKEIVITGVESVNDGKMVLKTETGTIDSSDVQYATGAEALVYEAVSKLGASPSSSWTMINGFKESDGVSAQDYATLLPLAYKYGKINYRNGLLNLDLTPKQSAIAFQMGRSDAEASVKATNQASTESTISEKNADKEIIFEGFTYSKRKANKVQKASMEAIELINKMSSLEIHVYQSYKKNGKLYAMVNGKERLAPNGYYTDGGKVYVDINAGNMGEGLMLYTLSHEIGHHIARYNAQDFKAISDFLFEHYGDNAPIYGLLEAQKKKLKKSYEADGKPIPSEAQLEKEAHEELVCDMLSRMLADKNAYDKLMELKQQDLNAFQKLGQAIKNALDKLAKVLGIYDNLNPDYEYAASAETIGEEAFRQLQDMYIKAFVQADANFQMAEKNTTEDGGEDGEYDIKLSPREENAFKQFANAINSVVNQSISGKGNIDGKAQVKDIMPTGPRITAMVAASSGNAIDISQKNIALSSSDIWHEYKRHTKATAEVSRGQIAFTKRQFQNAVKCIISPDIVETIFADTNNPTQRQSFAYAKKTTRGHYVVVEAVGGKKNPQIYPVLIVQFSKAKWNKMIAEGKSLGEMLHEGEPQKLLAQDVEKNKKSRVTAAQFASYEAIANTLHSPQLDTKVSQPDQIVNNESLETMDLEVDTKTESVSPTVLMSERTWTESDYVQEREQAAKEIAKAIGVSVKKAKAYIDSVNSIAKMIADDRVRLDYFSSPGRSSFVSNVEYGGSFDFSTLCKKRRLLTGTFTAIQKALPNTALTADEILKIRNRMKDAGLEVSCGLCYVEGSRANMGQFAKEFLKLYKQYYPDVWQPNMADVNTPDGIEWVRINHPECYEQYEYFWNHYGTLKPGDKNLFASQQKPKLYQLHTEYKGEILEKFNDDDNVEEKNLNGGIRLQSFSDFEIVHLIDTMQIIMDMSRVGLAGQAYTKVPDFAWALGDTGLKINLSLIAKGVDENGKLIFDDVEGMPIAEAMKLRDRYSKNVGTILVAFNDEQLLAAMADDRVDFIIPFHRSQWKKSQYGAMGLPAKTKDYTYMQNEKFIKPQYHEYRGRMVQDKASNYMPNEYWDFSKSGKENAEAYLEMCARNNKRPKFYKLLQNNGDGSYSLKADGSTDGYWKLLIDFKMYDNEGKGSPQMPVKPEFNMDEANRMMNDYQGGHSNFPVAQGIVDSFVEEYKDSHEGVQYSDRDSDYLDAVNRGDMETAQRMVDEAANERLSKSKIRDRDGTLLIVFHATEADFTVFDRKRINGWNSFGNGFYFTPSLSLAKDYGSKVGAYFLDIKNPVDYYAIDKALWVDMLERSGYEYDKEFVESYDEEALWDADLIDDFFGGALKGVNRYDAFADIVQMAGYDGIIAGDEIIAFDSNQIKSAEPVTYDDNGNVIPLSERFNKENDDIRYSDRDSDGNQLSAEQQKFFKDSKVRDASGNLLKVFHGTPKKFTTFRQGTAEGWGQGIYFTDNIEAAKEFGENIVEAYLNITNPFNADTMSYYDIDFESTKAYQNFDKKNWQRWYDEYDTYEEYRDDGMGVDIDMIYTEYVDVFNQILRELGYDGIIANQSNNIDGYEIVAFHENQPKLTSNTNPTFSDDMRYQDRDSDSVSNRSLLANAFEGLAQNDIERNKIQEYRSKVDLINAEERKLSELNEQIKELSFSKGPRDTKKIRSLQFEANQAANRINTYDKQLLRLEASKPLQDVLAREKKKAYQKAEKRGKDALAAYKEKTAKTQRELLERWQDSRKKGIEGRHKTAMRHKIKDVVNELNQYLLKGTKDRHVPESLQRAVAEALNAVNMDTVGAEERIAKLKAELLKAKTPEQIQEISRKIDHIQEMGDNMSGKLKRLKDAYEDLLKSPDENTRNSYDEVIYSKLDSVIDKIGNTPLRDMTLAQLEDVYDMYRMVLKAIRDANKSFKDAKNQSISTRANAVMAQVEEVGGKHKLSPTILNGIKKFGWNNLKPVYAFEHIGSVTLTEAFNNVRAGEDTWALDIVEAREFYLDKTKKYKYDSWDFQKQYKFRSTSDMEFSLNLEQILSLYAYSKRNQAADHLKYGGIVFDESTKIIKKTKLGISLEFNPTEATAYNISEETLADITSKLTDEQKAFADEMQGYLSTVMGAKGNEVSMAMYDIKLFKDKNYFPLKSAQQFMEKARDQQKGEVKIKNSGFSKETVPKAKNPIVLTPFMEVWANHVNEMSMYHAFVLPLEDFYRIYNYKTPSKDENLATEGVNQFIQNAYGRAATAYIDQLLKDLNGGARTDSTTGIINKMMGLFKKGAVFASMSVVVQQPSAIARAVALVDTKYFIGPKVDHKRHKALWDEVKQYAPVAIIKEMGYFDTNMGKSTQDYILGKEYSGFSEKMKALVTDSGYRDELLSKAPALADEVAWCGIWEAVKRETKANNPGMDVKSDAFLEMAGERFTDVIVKTQVYDSVLSRSGMMRSKDTGMKMATAFMAEPTTSINMVADALLQGKRGKKKYARSAIGAVIASQILNSILVSFVYAGRDDDEDETYLEKYISTLAGQTLDSLNPATYIPFIKDIVSIVKGYDVERSDMAVVSDLWSAWQNLSKDNVSAYRKVEGFAGSIAQIFGLPVKNIMRDVRGIYQTIDSFVNGQQTTAAGIEHAVKGAVTGKEVSDQQQLYEAYLSGDTAQIARVKGRFKDQNAINNAIRKGLRENDPRIHQAAVAWNANDLDEYMRIAKEIIAEKHFVQDDVVMAIRSEASSLEPDDGTTSTSKAKGLFTAEKFAEAIAQGDQAMANAIKADIIQASQKNGDTEEEAEKSFKSSAKSELKKLFLSGDISEQKAINALVTYCGSDEDGAKADVQYWAFKQDYPDVHADDQWFDTYYEKVADSGLDIGVYMEYRNTVSTITGEGKKEKRMAVINSLPITSAQKDALYFAEGWTSSKLYEAPWH